VQRAVDSPSEALSPFLAPRHPWFFREYQPTIDRIRTLPYTSSMPSSYSPPTSDEVRMLLRTLKLTGEKTAELLGLSAGRAIRHWTAGEAKLPFAKLYTLVHATTGMTCTPRGWREELSELLDNG